MMVIFDRVRAFPALYLVFTFGCDLLSHAKDRAQANIKKQRNQKQYHLKKFWGSKKSIFHDLQETGYI